MVKDHEQAAGIARVLRAAMQRHGVTHRGLAEMCGVSKAMVTRWLNPADKASIHVHNLSGLPVTARGS